MNTNSSTDIETGPSTQKIVVTYIACYTLLLLFGAIAFWLLFSIRSNLIDIAMAVQVNPWMLRAIDRWGIFLLGLCWLAAFIVIEAYLRQGVQKKIFWRRAGRTFLITGIVVLLTQAINWLI